MRRILVAFLALAAAAAVSPVSARPPSCYPLPDPACPPDQVTIPSQVYQQLPQEVRDAVKQNIPLPIYNSWPDANIAIVDNAGQPQFSPPAINVRQGGRMYIQNLDTSRPQHYIEEAGCETGGSCRFGKTIYAFELSYFAKYIYVSQALFPKRGEVVTYMCKIHPEMQGAFTVA